MGNYVWEMVMQAQHEDDDVPVDLLVQMRETDVPRSLANFG